MMVARIRWSHYAVVTILTLLFSMVWLVALVLRIFFNKHLENVSTLDGVMLLIVGYWFSTAALKSNPEEKE